MEADEDVKTGRLKKEASTGRTPVCGKVAVTVRELRVAKKLSQVQLAQRAEVSRRMIGAIEGGVRVPTIEMLERIAGGLRMRVDRLVTLAVRWRVRRR